MEVVSLKNKIQEHFFGLLEDALRREEAETVNVVKDKYVQEKNERRSSNNTLGYSLRCH